MPASLLPLLAAAKTNSLASSEPNEAPVGLHLSRSEHLVFLTAFVSNNRIKGVPVTQSDSKTNL